MKKSGYFKRLDRDMEKQRVRDEFKRSHPWKYRLLTAARVAYVLVLAATFFTALAIVGSYLLNDGDLSFLPDNPILYLLK